MSQGIPSSKVRSMGCNMPGKSYSGHKSTDAGATRYHQRYGCRKYSGKRFSRRHGHDNA